MEATYTLTGLEAQARQIIDAARSGEGWSPARAIILNTFEAMWSAALTAERVEKVGAALAGMTVDGDPIRRELTALVRAGVLRSRVNAGQRLYELNLKG